MNKEKQKAEEDISEAGVRLKRIDIHSEVEEEKEERRQRRKRELWFKIRNTGLNIYYGMNVKTIAGKISQFLRLYHEALQSLVQGYREVTMDAKGEFKFDKDGTTVQERMDKYEQKLTEYSSGLTQRVIQKKDELDKKIKE